MRKTCIDRRKIGLLEDEFLKRFEEKVIELVGILYLWGHVGGGVLQACNEVCGNNSVMRSRGDTWW